MCKFKPEFLIAFRDEAGSSLIREADRRLHSLIIGKATKHKDSGNVTVTNTLTGASEVR
jgi:hypothetical protein